MNERTSIALIATYSIFGLITCLAVGCGVQLDVKSTALPDAPGTATIKNLRQVEILSAKGNKFPINVGEVCIDGTAYLITETGGISAKFATGGPTDAFTKAYTYTCK